MRMKNQELYNEEPKPSLKTIEKLIDRIVALTEENTKLCCKNEKLEKKTMELMIDQER